MAQASEDLTARSRSRPVAARVGREWLLRVRWPRDPDGRRRGSDVPAAVATWLVLTPLAVLLVHVADLDPFTVEGVVMPVGVGAAVGAVLLLALLVTRRQVFVGVGLGAYAAWMSLVIAQALHGTPFGYGGMQGDEARLVAQATKYMSSWGATDAFVRHLPTEYPPLYPWLVGHLAAATNRDAWRLFGEAQIVLMGFAVVAAYVLWRRLVGPRTAFAVVAVSAVVWALPSKDYEYVTLLLLLPWVLATFAGLPRDRGGLHWLSAGVIGGLIVLCYPGFLGILGLGVVAIVVLALRAARRRRDYLLHLVGVVATAFVVASWYVVPYVVTLWTKGGNRVSDQYLASPIPGNPLTLPFFEPTPLALIELVGLVGVVWYRRSRWWAQPILLLVVSCYVYRMLYVLRTVVNGHTGYLERTSLPIGVLLATAGILTVVAAAGDIGPRVRFTPARAREVTAIVVVAIVAWTSVQLWTQWSPSPRGARDAAVPATTAPNLATFAHMERLPGGALPRYSAPVRPFPEFPTDGVRRVIEADLGAGARPVVLCYDQRLFAFLPYYAYLPPDRFSANTLQRWDDRHAALQRLAAVSDPTAFARAAGATTFGGIDVFVLRDHKSRWSWGDVDFSPADFDTGFHVVHVSSSVVVAVRR